MCSICHSYPCDPRCPNAPEPEAVYTCEYCGEPIVVGEEYYEYHGKQYHPECLESCAFELLIHDPDVSKMTAEADYDDDDRY